MMRPTLNGDPALRRRRGFWTNGHAHRKPSAADVLAASALAVLWVDAAGVLVLAEGQAAGRFGPLVGQSAFELAEGARFVPDDGAPCSAEVAIRRALAGDDVAGLVYVDDRVFEARVTTQVHRGAVVGACLVALDVTRHHAAQIRAVREDRMSALGTLAAGVANEINNPLTYVMINIEHVTRRLRRLGALDEDEVPQGPERTALLAGLVDALAKASEGANRVRAVTRDILVFAQGNDAPRGLVDVRALLESSLQVAWHELRHRARVVKHLADVPPLEASATQLAHVFLQLFVNAASAIPEGNAEHEEVRVTTRCDDSGDVVVEILDTGAGIAPEALPHVFDPFFTTHGAGEGVGLGLSICHGIVKHLGGQISAESGPGKGSVFRVVLPAGRHSANGSARESKAPQLRVLVVDADPLVGEAIARSLGEESELTVASDARQATQILLSSHFDFVLCDVMLPETSGVDFYVEVLRAAPHLVHRIVFMAGGASTVRARAFLSSIANPCLEKPLDMSELRRLVGRAATAR
jgi:signal transduction histidine kinase/BarA-like signal transduction histidine kinase